MLIQRQITDIINKYKKSVLLIGPRQTGKSTLITTLKPELIINLADEETFIEYLRDPGRLKKVIRNQKSIFIDEIQKIPSLLNTVQALIDTDKSLKFYLTGSSARKLKRGKANLLPGRIITYELGPLSLTELPDSITTEKLFSFGALPGILLESDESLAKKILRSYASTYLREEVQAESLTRNLEGFSRYFDIIASRSGDFIDYSKFASQASIERTSAKRYFEILSDTLITVPINPFTKSSKRRLIQHSRYYFFDVGVLNGALANFESSADRKGCLFEHLCLQLILSEAKALDKEIRISVYRTEAGAEVDFIIEIGRKLFAVEIKATKNIGSHDLRGLKSFQDFYGKTVKNFIFYLGEQKLTIDGILILPYKDGIFELFQNC